MLPRAFAPWSIPTVRAALVAAALLPALYLFVAIQHGAITVPFWDHAGMILWIDAYRSGTLRLADLWSPHNHSRPFTYRLIYLVNAELTGWDVRSEYVYMYLAIYAAFLVHVRILWCAVRSGELRFFALLCMLSFLYFSPVGHNNHWWSMMLQLNLTNLFIVLALWQVARDPHGIGSSAVAALWCWLATYTLTNGLIAFAACAALALLAARDSRDARWKAAFWVANLALVAALYFPGLTDEGGGRPGPLDLVWFALVYLGSPLGSFLHYRFAEPFGVIRSTAFNGLIGLALTLAALWATRGAWAGARRGERDALIVLGCIGFAVGSALVTAWGRAAFDELGVATANSSRYAIFSSYLLFGLLYYWAARPGGGAIAAAALPVALSVVLVAGVNTYGRAARVYRGAHDFDVALNQVYRRPSPDSAGPLLFPDPIFVQRLRDSMQRYELGPYRTRLYRTLAIPDGAPRYLEAVALTPGTVVAQRFTPDRNGLLRLELRFVTYNSRPGSTLGWELYDVAHSPNAPLARGIIEARRVRDWGTRPLPIPPLPASAGRELELRVRAPEQASRRGAVGLPLYAPTGAAPRARVERDGKESLAPGTLNLLLHYDP